MACGLVRGAPEEQKLGEGAEGLKFGLKEEEWEEPEGELERLEQAQEEDSEYEEELLNGKQCLQCTGALVGQLPPGSCPYWR